MPDWNVLLLTVDCLRPGNMGVYGHDQPTTPHIDAFAQESVVFDQAYAVSSWTGPNIVSLLTGLYPAVHAQESAHAWYDPALPSALRPFTAKGYRTAGRVNTGPNLAHLGLQKSLSPYAHTEEFIRERTAPSVFPHPFFVWSHWRETHLPYDPAPEVGARFGAGQHDSPAVTAARTQHTILKTDGAVQFSAADITEIQALYNGKVAEADARFGALIQGMRDSGMLERTIVVLTADHGEELGEHGWVGHATTTHDGNVWDEVLHIPLIIRVPGGTLTGRTDALAQSVDLMPTLYELLDMDPAAIDMPMQGISLVPAMKGQTGAAERGIVYAETTQKGWATPRSELHRRVSTVRTRDQKLIRVRDGGADRWLAYDLQADPGETTDLYAQDPAVWLPLKAQLQAIEEDNREQAAELALKGAHGRWIALRDALKEGRMADSLDAAAGLQRIHETWALGTDPFFVYEPFDRQWRTLRRKAAVALEVAMDRQERALK